MDEPVYDNWQIIQVQGSGLHVVAPSRLTACLVSKDTCIRTRRPLLLQTHIQGPAEWFGEVNTPFRPASTVTGR